MSVEVITDDSSRGISAADLPPSSVPRQRIDTNSARHPLQAQGRVHHSPETVPLGFQELGQYLLDSLNFLEEVCAFLAWHGCAPARMAAVI
jgi:hypothetical protein